MLLMLLLLVPSLAFAELAVEIIPGVTHYGGHTSSVEIIPGVKQFSGAYEGTVTELAPGITSYNLRPRYPERCAQPYVPPSIDRRPDLVPKVYGHPLADNIPE